MDIDILMVFSSTIQQNIGLTAVQGLVRNAANSPRRFVDLLGVA